MVKSASSFILFNCFLCLLWSLVICFARQNEWNDKNDILEAQSDTRLVKSTRSTDGIPAKMRREKLKDKRLAGKSNECLSDFGIRAQNPQSLNTRDNTDSNEKPGWLRKRSFSWHESRWTTSSLWVEKRWQKRERRWPRDRKTMTEDSGLKFDDSFKRKKCKEDRNETRDERDMRDESPTFFIRTLSVVILGW